MNIPWKRRPSHAEYAGQARLRAELYRVQARAMLDPIDAELAAFLQKNYPFLLPESFEGTDEAIKQLRVDFTNLFLLSSPPYEAALVDESGHLNSKATDAVTDFYRACGYNPGRGSAGLGHPGVLAMDHASVEIEFLARLIDEEAGAWAAERPGLAREKLSLSARFMDEHFMRWMPVYTLGVEEDAETHLYRELARWIREFAFSDRKYIARALKARGRRHRPSKDDSP